MRESPQHSPRVANLPVREEMDLGESRGKLLQRGAWGKADILLVESPVGKAIVKDFSRKLFPVRWYGRWQILREASIYRRLAGVPGVGGRGGALRSALGAVAAVFSAAGKWN